MVNCQFSNISITSVKSYIAYRVFVFLEIVYFRKKTIFHCLQFYYISAFSSISLETQ